MRRCSRLRTLVLVLDDQDFCYFRGDKMVDLVARLPALVLGAPALCALQLVLPMMPSGAAALVEGGLGALCRALEALPNLASLALGWALTPLERRQKTAGVGERIADVLDAMQVGLSGWQALKHDERGHTSFREGVP